MAQKATSIDVAARAGVSQATVARTFSAPQLVSANTRARVEAAAEALGYVPNVIARSPKSRQANLVGAVIPAQGEYWQMVLTVFSRKLAERCGQLLLFSFAEADQVQPTLDAVDRYRLDSLVLASSRIGVEHLARMQRPTPRIVALNQPMAAGLCRWSPSTTRRAARNWLCISPNRASVRRFS